MQIDERALNFIQKAKAAGFSQQEVYEELLAKGYEIGAPRVEQPTEPEKSPYSTMDKVKHTLRAAGEAAPFGMGDLVAGYVGAQARNLADYTHGKDLKTRVKGLGKLAFGIISPKDFKEERADFIKGQEEFAKHHGGLNFAGEMVGGLLTGGAGAARNVIGKQGIKALMNAGAREGAKFGAAYGAGSGFTQDTDKLSVPNALIGAGTGLAGGAVMGAALPPAVAVGAKAISPVVKGGKAVAKKIATILKNDAQQANQALGNAGYVATDMTPENKVFFNLLEANPEGTMEAVRKGDPLIAHANRQQLRRTRGAVTSDEKADQAFIEAKRAFDQGKIQKGEDISDRLLSKESGYTATERIADEAHGKYQPLYEEVMKMGEIDLPQEIIANETILGAIQEAQGRAGYTKLKANNVRVLDKAKRVLQDKYKSLKRAGKNDEAREYQLAKEELVAFMDSKLPQYAEARKAFMEGQELQEFVDLGRRIKNISHAEVERIAKTLTPEEQQALKAGIGDSVRESLYNTRNEGSNVLEKAFPAPLRRKLEVLGIKDEEIAKEIGKELQTNANYQFVGGGSNTMNKAEDVAKLGFGPLVRTIKAIRNPLGTLEKAADKLDNKIAGLDSEEIARLMFNAEALAKEAKKPEHQRRIAEILRKSKQDKSGQSIAGYLGGKLKEKGGYAMGNPRASYIKKGRGESLNSLIRKEEGLYPKSAFSKEHKLTSEQKSFLEKNYNPSEWHHTGMYANRTPFWSKEEIVGQLAESGKLNEFRKLKDKGFLNEIKDLNIKNQLEYEYWKESVDDYKGWKAVVSDIRMEIEKKGEKPFLLKKLKEAEEMVKKAEQELEIYKKPASQLQSVKQVVNSLGEPVAKTKEGIKNFNKWFKGSKVVDEQGRPLVVYHGSFNKFSEFDKSKINPYSQYGGKGFFFAKDPEMAKMYGDNVYPVYLNAKTDFRTAKKTGSKIDHYYDKERGIYVVFEPTQIKSVKNSGKFDPKNPNIYKSLIGGLGISQILKSKENK